MGVIEILATGKGHDELKLTDNGAENKTKVDELLGKKYLITVEVGEGDQKESKKVTSFDGEKNEFVIEEIKRETVESKTELRVPAATAKATAVAPTAGG